MNQRKAIFDAVRPHLPEPGFSKPGAIELLNKLCDLYGLPANDDAPPAPAIALPDDYWPMLAKIESGNRPYIKASTSSASGLYQFIKSTWQGEGGQWGMDPDAAFGGLRPSEAEQLQRAKTFTTRNAAYLANKGIPINKASLYAAHFFGPQTAARVIAADVNARADLIAGDAATRANPSILKGKTVGEFMAWLHAKTGAWAR